METSEQRRLLPSETLNSRGRGRATKLCLLSLLTVVSTAACAGALRSPDRYRDDARATIEARNREIRSCYDTALEQDRTLQGMVVVKFKVEKKTGAFTEVEYDQQETTAPESLAACVVDTLKGMRLDPADQRDGIASFRWEFTPSSTAAAL